MHKLISVYKFFLMIVKYIYCMCTTYPQMGFDLVYWWMRDNLHGM